MQVRMLTSRAGPRLDQRMGETYDLPEREAMALIAAGQAEMLGTETAALSESQTAALRIDRPQTRKERRDARPVH